jgi:hypothetical protein
MQDGVLGKDHDELSIENDGNHSTYKIRLDSSSTECMPGSVIRICCNLREEGVPCAGGDRGNFPLLQEVYVPTL